MIGAGTIRARLLQGDTYARIGADLGISADAMRKRAARLGVKSTTVLGRHRRRTLAVPWREAMARGLNRGEQQHELPGQSIPERRPSF